MKLNGLLVSTLCFILASGIWFTFGIAYMGWACLGCSIVLFLCMSGQWIVDK